MHTKASAHAPKSSPGGAQQLVVAGFPPPLAWRPARRRTRYDLHALIELVERGCPPELAVRILAPLEEDERGVSASSGYRGRRGAAIPLIGARPRTRRRPSTPSRASGCARLRADGATREDAVARLHALLLRPRASRSPGAGRRSRTSRRRARRHRDRGRRRRADERPRGASTTSAARAASRPGPTSSRCSRRR